MARNVNFDLSHPLVEYGLESPADEDGVHDSFLQLIAEQSQNEGLSEAFDLQVLQSELDKDHQDSLSSPEQDFREQEAHQGEYELEDCERQTEPLIPERWSSDTLKVLSSMPSRTIGRNRGAIISQYCNKTLQLRRRRQSKPAVRDYSRSSRPSIRDYDIKEDTTDSEGRECTKREQLVINLQNLSVGDREKMLRGMPLCLAEKRELRTSALQKDKQRRSSSKINCCSPFQLCCVKAWKQCLYIWLSFIHSLHLWKVPLKRVSGRFGTGVLSYFLFLKTLLFFNLFLFLVMGSFLVLPQAVYPPELPEDKRSPFTGLELLTGAGNFSSTLMYYGYYSNYTLSSLNSTKVYLSYNMPLAYFFTIGMAFFITCIILVYSMSKSFGRSFRIDKSYSVLAVKTFCSWDFRVIKKNSTNLMSENISTQLKCWESMVGQALYRLVIFDFLFLMLGSFFGEFLSNVIGTKLQPRLGVPEFDVAKNVLDLIYAQTLAWIGIYFSPLLPAIQIVKFFILFYLKKVSLTQNCQPPRQSSRAAQMQTIFIVLLFFPFFVGALSMVAYAWTLTPSEQCGPFQGLNKTFSVVEIWISHLKQIHTSNWVVWIYENIIRSELFYFLLTLIVIVIIYIFWQLIQGRKELIRLLQRQIVNEGKDKSFLLERLQDLQNSYPQITPKPIMQQKPSRRRSGGLSSGSQSNSNAMVQVLLARQQIEEEEQRRSLCGVSVPSDISTSSATTQALLARQRAERQNEDFYQMSDEHPSSFNPLDQAMAARQRSQNDERDDYWSTTGFNEANPINRPDAVTQAMEARLRAEDGNDDHLASPVSSVMIQVMQARQRADEEKRSQWTPAPLQNPDPSGSSALIQAMLARQQAQNEYDDGY